MQKLRQFEFLTLAIKISFLFNFCTDVLLSKDDEGLTAALKPFTVSTQLLILNYPFSPLILEKVL